MSSWRNDVSMYFGTLPSFRRRRHYYHLKQTLCARVHIQQSAAFFHTRRITLQRHTWIDCINRLSKHSLVRDIGVEQSHSISTITSHHNHIHQIIFYHITITLQFHVEFRPQGEQQFHQRSRTQNTAT